MPAVNATTSDASAGSGTAVVYVKEWPLLSIHLASHPKLGLSLLTPNSES